MSDKPETLAAILAEMRDLADHRAADAGGERPVIELLRSYADRLDAAAERERAELRRQLRNEIEINNALATVRPQFHYVDDVIAEAEKERAHEIELAKLRAPGNAAAMRAALENAISVFRDDLPTPRDISRAFAAANAALAAPARNCDRTKDEAESAFKAKFGRPWNTAEDELASWLFAPAEGGAE